MSSRTAEYPRPDHFILHVSDTHVLAGEGMLYDRVASDGHLRQLFDEFEASGGRPEAIVFTGDLADRGEPEAYDRIRSIVDPVAHQPVAGDGPLRVGGVRIAQNDEQVSARLLHRAQGCGLRLAPGGRRLR